MIVKIIKGSPVGYITDEKGNIMRNKGKNHYRLWAILRSIYYHYKLKMLPKKEIISDVDKISIKEVTSFPKVIENFVLADPMKSYARMFTTEEMNALPTEASPRYKKVRYEREITYKKVKE